jgi:hypothetical protein
MRLQHAGYVGEVNSNKTWTIAKDGVMIEQGVFTGPPESALFDVVEARIDRLVDEERRPHLVR